MADNIAITEGSGTIVATDDISSVHYQRVKLVDGTLDSTAAIPGSATDGLLVNLGANNDVTVTSGAVTVSQGTAASLNCTEASAANILTAVQLIDNPVLVDDAAYTAASSSVMMAGFTFDDTNTDLLDEGDAGAARITADRKLVVMIGGAGSTDVKGGGSKTDTSDQSIMVAGGAGVYNYLQWVTIYNASTTSTYVNIKDGATVVAVLPLPAYGGALFQPARAIRGTANTAWNLATGASVTTAYLYGGGYKSFA